MDTPLLNFWRSLTQSGRDDFSRRCGTTSNHLRNVAYGMKSCSPRLAVNIERETNGVLRCEILCPDGVDWTYLRSHRLAVMQG